MNYENLKKQSAEDLTNYLNLKTASSDISQKIKRLESSNLYQSSFNNQPDIAAVSRIEALKKQLYTIDEKIDKIEIALSMLSQEDKQILTTFYISRKRTSVNTIARNSYTHRSTVYRRAHKALEKYIQAYFM